MTKLWARLLQVVPALLVTGFLLTACSTVGGKGGGYFYEEYQTMEVHLTDGRILECIYFGAHAGYDCDWDNIQ